MELAVLFKERVKDFADCLGLAKVQVLPFLVSTCVGGSSHVPRLSKSLRCLLVLVVAGSSSHLTEDQASVASLRSPRVPVGMVC